MLGEAMRACEARDGRRRAARPGASARRASTSSTSDAREAAARPAPRTTQGSSAGRCRDNEVARHERRRERRAPRRRARRRASAAPCAKTAIAVPLEGEDERADGRDRALQQARRAPGFTDEDRALLVLITANASTAIRLQLSREAREREERLTTIGRLLSGVIHDLQDAAHRDQRLRAADADRRATRRSASEYAELVLKQFDHIGAMQREVLEFARGEKSVLVRKVYLQKFFDDVRDAARGASSRAAASSSWSTLQDEGTARFDEGKILRVVHNLARNAVEAMGDQGRQVRHQGHARQGRTARSSSPSRTPGPGIPKEIEHRLFQSFVTSGKKGGTGLGLAIVKKIAEEHGGTITVQSSSRGATFKLRLPQPRRER